MVDVPVRDRLIVLAMQHASKGSPASKGIKVGDILRTPSGERIKVHTFNISAIKAILGAGQPPAPARKFSPCPPPPPRRLG